MRDVKARRVTSGVIYKYDVIAAVEVFSRNVGEEHETLVCPVPEALFLRLHQVVRDDAMAADLAPHLAALGGATLYERLLRVKVGVAYTQGMVHSFTKIRSTFSLGARDCERILEDLVLQFRQGWGKGFEICPFLQEPWGSYYAHFWSAAFSWGPYMASTQKRAG